MLRVSTGRKIEDEDGEEKTLQQIRGFRVVYVFDISQTEGEDLPDLDAVRSKLLDGDAPEGIWDALVTQANAAGFEVIRDRKRSENGYCDFLKREIAVRPDVAPAQGLKTLVHELAHALLHADELPRSKEVAEVEVESVAYIVCDTLGLDSGEYSFPYVTRWAEGSSDLVGETPSVRSVARSRSWRGSWFLPMAPIFRPYMFAADFHSRRRCAMSWARSSSLPPSSTWRSEGSARR